MLIMKDSEALNNYPVGFGTDIPSEEVKNVLEEALVFEDFEIDAEDIEIKVSLIIRTDTNKVMTYEGSSGVSVIKDLHIVTADCSHNHERLLLTISKFIKDTFQFRPEVMRESVLQVIGTVNDEQYVSICYQLIIKEKYAKELVPTISGIGFKEITDVSTFTNLQGWTKIILPTLKIVKE